MASLRPRAPGPAQLLATPETQAWRQSFASAVCGASCPVHPVSSALLGGRSCSAEGPQPLAVPQGPTGRSPTPLPSGCPSEEDLPLTLHWHKVPRPPSFSSGSGGPPTGSPGAEGGRHQRPPGTSLHTGKPHPGPAVTSARTSSTARPPTATPPHVGGSVQVHPGVRVHGTARAPEGPPQLNADLAGSHRIRCGSGNSTWPASSPGTPCGRS